MNVLKNLFDPLLKYIGKSCAAFENILLEPIVRNIGRERLGFPTLTTATTLAFEHPLYWWLYTVYTKVEKTTLLIPYSGFETSFSLSFS